jgi:hypothetical protein
MSEAVEALERAEKLEHTSHGDHAGHQRSNKLIGLTMGLIGVLIALCAALVGGQRNEMSRAMIEQTQATADATSASTKFRIVLISIEQLRAQPTLSDATRERFVRLYDDYLKERKFTSAWAASYRELIDAHFEAAEGYEHAQVVAEVGIVFASLAVLLANRLAWLVSIALAVGSLGLAGNTYFETRAHVGPALAEIEHHESAYEALRKSHVGDHADADAADALDPGGTFRKAIEAEASAAATHPPAAEKKEHH